MNISKIAPPESLTAHIESIVHLDVSMKELLLQPLLFVPNGYPGLVIHLKKPVIVLDHASAFTLPEMFFSGVLNRYSYLELLGDISTVIVLFKPNALHHLLKIDMKHLNKVSYVNAVDVVGHRADTLYNRLLDAATSADRFRAIISFLESYASRRLVRAAGLFDHVIESIIKQHGCVRISDITRNFNIAERSFYHKFMTEIGLCPKEYMRIVRFNHIFSQFKHFPGRNWFDIIAENGLFDQSHLIREVKHYTGLSPKALLSLNLEQLELTNGMIDRER